MRPNEYAQLCAVARRNLVDASEAEDVVQEALLAAFEAGRVDFAAAETRQWLAGTVRNKARMAARTSGRRLRRESQWLDEQDDAVSSDSPELLTLLNGLTAPLKAVAVLALSGHNRREIQYLLRLSDATLRQRIASLKRQIRQFDVQMPDDLPALLPGLAYGRIRQTLRSKLFYRGGVLASHDPDGHLFVIGRSQNP